MLQERYCIPGCAFRVCAFPNEHDQRESAPKPERHPQIDEYMRGYSSCITRCFRKEVGVPPSEFRMQNKQP